MSFLRMVKIRQNSSCSVSFYSKSLREICFWSVLEEERTDSYENFWFFTTYTYIPSLTSSNFIIDNIFNCYTPLPVNLLQPWTTPPSYNSPAVTRRLSWHIHRRKLERTSPNRDKNEGRQCKFSRLCPAGFPLTKSLHKRYYWLRDISFLLFLIPTAYRPFQSQRY